MSIVLSSFLICFGALELSPGTELNYSATVSHQAKSGPAEVKSFSLYALTLPTEDGSPELVFFLDERGWGWGWPERFGVAVPSRQSHSKPQPIRILLPHDGQQYPIQIMSPVVEFREQMATQSRWSNGRYEYAVARQRKVMDRECTQVEVTSAAGPYQTLVIETSTGILMSLEEKIIVGRGDQYQLKMSLQSQNQLSGVEVEKNRQLFQALSQLQGGLNRTGDQKSVELTRGQLDQVSEQIPQLKSDSEGTAWGRLVSTINLDLQHQKKRLDGVAGLQSRLIGHPAPNWSMKLNNGKVLSDESLKGKVVVLHFWQYRNEPLTEPYGQIGYLDFLANKRKKLGVEVIGINVDERFANPQQSAAANRSMKGLLDFMRTGYDVATDDGAVLSEFGDPRALGSSLPLWIVVGHDGVITHIHTGFYGIKPDEGLKELDDAVIEAIRKQKAS